MRYPGGKGKCYQHIINIFPPHETYIETHLGGGSVLRQKKGAAINIGVDRDPAVIHLWRANYPKLASYVEADAVEFLRSQQFVGNELVYADPPYLPTTRRRSRVYRFDYSEGDHIRLLYTLKQLPCSVVISGYASELYDEYLKRWCTTTFSAATHRGIREEKLWFNFVPPAYLHDARYLGRNFRERQTIKRRLQRLQARIRELSPQERFALFGSLFDIRLEGESIDGTDDGSMGLSVRAQRSPESLLPSEPVTRWWPLSHQPFQMSLFDLTDSEANPKTVGSLVEKKAPQRTNPAPVRNPYSEAC